MLYGLELRLSFGTECFDGPPDLYSKVQKIQSLVALESGDLVLDIGSNDGTTLGGYTVPGLRRVGMDPTGSKFKQFYPDEVELIPTSFSRPVRY